MPASSRDSVIEVLGSGTDERDAAYVDFFDNVGFGRTAGYGLLKGVEVYDDKVNLGDVILLHLFAVALQVASAKDAAEHFGMKRLDTSAKDGGISREVFHLLAGDAERLNKLLGAAGREQRDAFGVEFGLSLIHI